MRPVDPSIAAFGEKCAGLFWKDMPQHHNIATELSILNAGKGDPDTLHYVLPAKRTQEPRLLTRLFSSPRGHYNAVRSALDYHGIYDPFIRAEVGGDVLRKVWPSIYKPLEKKPDLNRPMDLFEHYYAELEKKKKKAPAKQKQAEDEKQAISARLVAKALERASQRAMKGEITPERLKRFAKKTERWSEGANKRVFNSVGKRTVATIPRADDASRAFVEPLRSRQIPASIASAYDKTRAKIHSRSNKPPSSPATTTIPAVKQVTLGEMLLGGNGSSGFYDTDTHTVGGNFLHSPPVLFHELGHALDFGGRGTSAREERNAQKLLAESIAWRRGSQLYDTWRKSLPQENKPNELDAAEMPTTRDVLRFRDAPLETYRLKHLNSLAGQFNNAMTLNMPIVRPPMDIGPHGRVFARTQQALRDAARYVANHEYEKHRAAEAASKPTTIEFTGEKTPTSKTANFLNDYAYHFNQLYNPESYGIDIRTPTGRDDLRNIAVSTAVGTGLGAIRGAIWPGYIEKLDEAGRVISKKKRGRLLGSLRDAVTSGALSGISSAAGITAKKYMPEIEQALIKAKDTIASKLPGGKNHG